MRNLIRHIKAAWLFGKHFPYIPEVDLTEWTESDAQATSAFFGGTTAGKKLAMRLRNYSVRSAMSACQKPNGDHANGIAGGISMAAAMIDAHQVSYGQESEENKIVNL